MARRGPRAFGGDAVPPEIGRTERRALLGFRDGDRGTHSSRTLMLAEIELLLETTSPGATMADHRRAVVEDNVLGKRTHTTREHTVRKLKALYGLEPALPIYRTLRTFWELDDLGRPLLAMLCALARDPLLRLTSDAVLDAPTGNTVTPERLEELLRERVPGRFSAASERSIARNALSSWTQSGHLAGRLTKTRQRAAATPGSTAYALFLAYLEGRTSRRLFDSFWARVLDAPAERLMELALAASQRGLLDYRSAGGMIDVRFPDLLTPEEEGLLHDE